MQDNKQYNDVENLKNLFSDVAGNLIAYSIVEKLFHSSKDIDEIRVDLKTIKNQLNRIEEKIDKNN